MGCEHCIFFSRKATFRADQEGGGAGFENSGQCRVIAAFERGIDRNGFLLSGECCGKRLWWEQVRQVRPLALFGGFDDPGPDPVLFQCTCLGILGDDRAQMRDAEFCRLFDQHVHARFFQRGEQEVPGGTGRGLWF